VLLACLVGIGLLPFGIVTVSRARVLGTGPGGFSADLTVAGTGTASFSAAVHPHGRATTAFFQFGLAARYREPRPRGTIYDESTPSVHLPPTFGSYSVSGRVSGLVPNALYNLRLVASSSAGTVYSPEATFRTLKDPAPGLPLIATTMNLAPVSGLVLHRFPRGRPSRAGAVARLVQGSGFLPLTEKRQLPIGSQIDARAGALRLTVAGSPRRNTQQFTLAGALVSVSQTRGGPGRGLTTVRLLEGAFPGAPTYDACPADASAHASDARGPAAPSSSEVLQTLHARDLDGSLQTSGRYSAATGQGAGAVWDTVDRCDGTLTVVHRGTVIVSDSRLGQTFTIHGGQRYLARAS
jgi:hypothetical protein